MQRVLLVCWFLLLSITAQAEWIEFASVRSEEEFSAGNGVEEIEVYFSLPGFEIEQFQVLNENFSRISYPGSGEFVDLGQPDLPRFSHLLAIPDQGSVDWEIIYTDPVVFNNIQVLPRQNLNDNDIISETDFVIDRSFYNSSQIFPESLVQGEEPVIMRDLRLFNLIINPFQYNAAERSLTVYKNIELLVTISGTEGENQKYRQRPRSRFFEPLYEAVVLNYDTFRNRDEDYQNPSYLFIYPNDATVSSYLQTLTTWKHQKGFLVTAVSTATTGTTLTSIKSYIQNAYDTWQDPPEFVCLVGDAGGTFNIPTASYGGGVGDQEYTRLDGTDILADVFIGRLSFNSYSELQTIIAKIYNYEKTPFMGNTGWYNRALLVGDPSSSGQSTITTSKYIKELIESYNPAYSYDEVYSSPFVSNMTNSLNNGVTYYNYRGYIGMSGWSNTNTTSLTNGFMLPMVMILTCATGNFSSGDAASEVFLKAGSASTPKGGIGAVGTATSSTHTCFNNSVCTGAFYGIFVEGIFNMGGALTRGKLNLYNQYPQNPQNHVYNFSYWNNLMGDPGLELWTGVPQNLNVSYQSSLPLGTDYLQVEVLDAQSQPLADAWVTVLKGADEIFATAFTDRDGLVILPVNTVNTGNATITVTKHGFIPHSGTINIYQDNIFVGIDSWQIDDDNSGSSSGNGNGQLNPGENIELRVKLKNFGSQTAPGVSATLSCHNDDIIITDNYENYGDLPAGIGAFSLDDFDFSLPANMLGGTELRFDLDIQTTSRENWTDHIYLAVAGPNLNVQSINILDLNNSILDPGETSTVTITLQNGGSVVASNIQARFRCTDNRITIIDSVGSFGNIAAQASITNTGNPFNLSASDQIISGTQIPCTLYLFNTLGFAQTLQFLLTVGSVDVFDPLGPDEYGYYIYDDGDVDFSIAPYYNWIEIDPTYGGSGTVHSLTDNGNTGAITTVSLPFTLFFYGQAYNTATICTNGWIAPGSTEQYNFMNWQIPGPMGPFPMIAPFWDDLKTSGGGHICTYNDQANHQFIIEWSHMQNEYNNAEETFQVILRNPAYYPTLTGDAEIIVQYKVINNVDQGDYSAYHVQHGQFATVGIEDHTQTVGLEYTYNNTYPTAAKPLQNQMALLITTNVASVVEPPQADFSVTGFDFQVLPGNSDSGILEISNSGEANLVYNISKDYQDSRSLDLGRDSGGPDNFGYQWVDSNEPGGPLYNWVDITTVGTALTLADDNYVTVNLPFTFNFYGSDKTWVNICSNGYLTFTSSGSDWTNNPIPDSQTPNDFIAPFWDDLKPIGGSWGTVYYYYDLVNNRFIVEYNQVSHWHNTTPRDPETFQVILYPNGNILFQYQVVSLESDYTVGIENAAGNDGLQIVYYNNTYLENNLAILIRTVTEWVEITPANGTVSNGGTAEITVSVDAADLELGEYLCNLIVTTNDPENSQLIMPLYLTVGEIILVPPSNLYITVEGTTEPRIMLNWDAVDNADYYRVYTSSDPHTPFTAWVLAADQVDRNYWTLPDNPNLLFFRVAAVND